MNNFVINLPKNNRLTNSAKITMEQLPNKNITTKSAVCPLNEFSSSIRQYRYVNIILKKKLKPNVPKNKNVVNILQICKYKKLNDENWMVTKIGTLNSQIEQLTRNKTQKYT